MRVHQELLVMSALPMSPVAIVPADMAMIAEVFIVGLWGRTREKVAENV